MDTLDFIEKIKSRHGVTSDYAVSKLLGIRPSAISGYRAGRSRFDERLCVKVAQLLDMPPGYVLASIAAERAQEETVKAAWRRTAESLGRAAMWAVAVIGLVQFARYGLTVESLTDQAAMAVAGFTVNGNGLHIMRILAAAAILASLAAIEHRYPRR